MITLYRFAFVYLERGRLEIDDSSVKWIDSEGNLVRLPVATMNCLLLGPGTSITHEAVKVMAAANCSICLLVFQRVSVPPFYKIWGMGDTKRKISTIDGLQLIFEKLEKDYDH